MATMPVQLPRAADSQAAARARFFNSGNAFNVHLPDVPAASFDIDVLFAEDEREADDEAKAKGSAEGHSETQTSRSPWRLCDQSDALGSPVPATTPLMLARYLRLTSDHRDQPLIIPAEDNRHSGSIWYVIAGKGTTEQCGERFHWGPGDVFMTVGGVSISLGVSMDDAVDSSVSAYADEAAGVSVGVSADVSVDNVPDVGRNNVSDIRHVVDAPSGALLWCVDNSPLLAHEHVSPTPASATSHAAVAPLPVHFPAAEIERQLETLFNTRANATTSGFALIFSSAAHERSRNLLPTLTLSLNTLPAGEVQRPHRHNSAAITLVLSGTACSTLVDGVRCDWLPWRTLVTPAGAWHSHHNDDIQNHTAGDTKAGRARFLIVQDGGLYYLGRTMGFSFAGADAGDGADGDGDAGAGAGAGAGGDMNVEADAGTHAR